MNYLDLSKAIDDRLDTDATLATLTGGRYYFMTAPPGTAYPYVVYSVVSDNEQDAFNGDIREVFFELAIFDKTANGLADIEAIKARLKGDSTSPSSAPTYGFHRHVLSLTGGWTGGPVVRVGGDLYLEDKETYHAQETYRLLVSKA